VKKPTKYNQSNLFEFKPDDTISVREIIELSELIRIGVCGSTLSNASPELKKYFVQVNNEVK
jgi:hypothetical protein